jgi:hypothetical protein
MADVTRLHKWHHDDYNVAKHQIYQALGDLADIDIFGRQVLVAVYVRPDVNPVTGVYQTIAGMKEDWWQGKSVLILKCGPDAFEGDASYIAATFPANTKPVPGEWMFANANAGIQISLMGENAEKVMTEDRRGEMVPVFDWDGWPCRIIPDDQFLGRIARPHSVI